MIKILFTIVTVLFSGFTYAAGGGLQAGTDLMNELKIWGYGFIASAALVYILYTVGMALMERKQWSDVGMALFYSSVAGGCILAGEFMHDLWG